MEGFYYCQMQLAIKKRRESEVEEQNNNNDNNMNDSSSSLLVSSVTRDSIKGQTNSSLMDENKPLLCKTGITYYNKMFRVN